MGTVVPAQQSCAVKVACGVNYKTAIWAGSIAKLGTLSHTGKPMQYSLRPLTAFDLRCTQLEHRPTLATVEGVTRRSFAPAKQRRAVQVARLVEGEIAESNKAVIASLKAVQHCLRPRIASLRRRRQLIYGAASNGPA